MVQADYRGARGSNAGDDFHELWALRQALALLDPDTGLTAVAVEGLMAEDESGTPRDTWDGVDCTLYYGSDHAASAERIVIEQLKYSAANPDQAWTVARLIHSSNKKKNNSVVGRLAKAFVGLNEKRSDLVTSGQLIVRLVSNQPVDPAVLIGLKCAYPLDKGSHECSEKKSDRELLFASSGLPENHFETFAGALDLSECGSESRFALEERILTTISKWTDDDARAAVNDLLRFVHRAMLPEGKAELITRQSILVWMGFSDPAALFPCPPTLKRVEHLIPRGVSRDVVERMLSGMQRICLHGEGGCGKTTALQEIEALLPSDSLVIIFDCFGNGRYLDADAYRHRSRDAFLQLSNDLASRLRVPLLVNRSADLDYPKVFKKRLEKAAEAVASRAEDALLVIVVDAADNSVTAANTRSPAEPSFVHDFMALGELPRNVRFIVTGRTGLLSKLHLPHSFTHLPITGFTSNETVAHVRGMWKDAPDTWIEDFHHLSHGNPRVQRYALDYAGAEPARALEYLRPHGKGLDQIFLEQLKHARLKAGHDQDITAFCAGLIALPRPVPIADLSAVTGLNEHLIRDLCSDLAPGVRLTNSSIGFADEDFEHFVRSEAEMQLGLMQTRIAEHFVSRHRSDEYAAAHVAAALLVAGRGREIINLIHTEREPKAISDPVLRREAQLQRLRTAMKVCREAGDNVETMMILLIGAEALKTDAAIRGMLVENPDLAAHFARAPSSRAILRDRDEIENHGPLLFQLMAADARDGDGISVREGYRQLQAWLQRRRDDFADQIKKHPRSEPQGWSINERDIAAETEAMLRIVGPRRAVENVLRWRPRSIALQVASILSSRLIIAGEAALVERCITEAKVSSPWDLFLLTPLALAGKEVELSRLESSLASLLRLRLIRPDKLKDIWKNDNATAEYFDMLLTACEVVIARGGDRARVIPVLERIAARELRRRDRLFSSQIEAIDFSLRAHALLERLAGRTATLETYWVSPPEPSAELLPKQVEQLKRSDDQKKEELQNFIMPLINIYDIRAQALLGLIALGDVDAQLQSAILSYHNQEYRISRDFNARGMKTRAALSITRLMVLPSLDRSVLFERASSLLNTRSEPFDMAQVQILASLALDRSLHQQILRVVTARASVVRNMKASAEDKLSALIRLARLLVPISHEDAESLFNDAIEVAGEVNIEAVHEIALFAPLAQRAVGTMGVDQRRAVARDFAIIVGDTGVRLAGHDHFPWTEAGRVLATLDVCLALAATARWEDSSIIGRAIFLPAILETALRRRELSPTQVAALSSLLDQLSVELIVRITEEASGQRGDLNLKALSEDLAREELLRFGHGLRQQVSEKLNSLAMSDGSGFWANKLMLATAFHKVERPIPPPAPRESELSPLGDQTQKERPDPLGSIDWAAHRFVSAEDINDMIGRVFAAARVLETFVSFSEISDRIRSVVAISDRIAHLEALCRSETSQVTDYEMADAITKCIDDWHDAPSVDLWCRERLIQVVVARLPAFARWLANGRSRLPVLLQKSGLPDQQICTGLLEGIESHVDAFGAPTVYALIGLVGRYCAPADAAQVIARYAARLVERISLAERDKWDLTDVPIEAAGGIARLLYVLMGDIDVRIRWRAAHTVRRLARLGEMETIDKLVGLYGRTSEQSYRTPDAPFYWLAARLWLVIALDRIAAETPSAVTHHGRWLLEIATDNEFPHIVVRAFAKSAVINLVDSGYLALDVTQRHMLKRANTSPIRRKKRRDLHSVGFEHYGSRENKKRRFHFDSLDTLPYWYSGAIGNFADLEREEFLDAAECWIMDHWGVQSETWRWDQEPRQDRFSDSVSSMHSHGSLPILERFHTYLEWHAMWCATGELMQTRALARSGEDNYHTFEHWLGRNGLTTPPFWVSDLRGLKPLEDRLWFAPQTDIDVWVENLCDGDFLIELGLVSKDGTVVISGHHDTRSRNFSMVAKIESALVSSDTAAALVRALQTVEDSWDYLIPTAGHHLEIDAPPYRLVGWLDNVELDLGIDERDPLRYDVHMIRRRPSAATTKTLGLKFVFEDNVGWVDTRSRERVFNYEAWGDTRGDERDNRLHYDENVRSNGWRLRIDKEALEAFLNKVGLDLIVEIEITRGNKNYDYPRHDEEKAKESRFDKVILLRRDGTIETAEGRLGTWKAPRK